MLKIQISPPPTSGLRIQSTAPAIRADPLRFEQQAACQPTNHPAALMRGEHEVESLGLSGSALSAAVSHLGQDATTPAETMTRGSLMV